jgi:hypothetical protein
MENVVVDDVAAIVVAGTLLERLIPVNNCTGSQ